MEFLYLPWFLLFLPGDFFDRVSVHDLMFHSYIYTRIFG